jgi:hypothetical protein
LRQSTANTPSTGASRASGYSPSVERATALSPAQRGVCCLRAMRDKQELHRHEIVRPFPEARQQANAFAVHSFHQTLVRGVLQQPAHVRARDTEPARYRRGRKPQGSIGR